MKIDNMRFEEKLVRPHTVQSPKDPIRPSHPGTAVAVALIATTHSNITLDNDFENQNSSLTTEEIFKVIPRKKKKNCNAYRRLDMKVIPFVLSSKAR